MSVGVLTLAIAEYGFSHSSPQPPAYSLLPPLSLSSFLPVFLVLYPGNCGAFATLLHCCTTSTITRQKVTGDSTYYGEPLLALQGGGADGGAEEQTYDGVMVEGSGAEYSSSGDWTKYYDAEYACDYYHNYR